MMLSDDGDLIRGLGYVALYSAYLEDAIETVFQEVLHVNGESRDEAGRLSSGQKLRHIEHSIKSWEGLTEGLSRFVDVIAELRRLLEETDAAVHGRVYKDPQTGDVLKPARDGSPETPATSAELYELADTLSCAVSPCVAAIYAIGRYEATRTAG